MFGYGGNTVVGGRWEDLDDEERLEQEKSLKYGKPVPLGKVLIMEDVDVQVFGQTEWLPGTHTLKAYRKIESYRILWQLDDLVLVRVKLVPWKAEDEYDVYKRYRIVSRMKKSEIVFTTKKSLTRFKAS